LPSSVRDMSSIAHYLRGDAEGRRDLAPRRDVEAVLCAALGASRAYLYAHADEVVPNDAVRRIEAGLDALARGMPVAYISGAREFWNLKLAVTPAVLIPRPETELLVELALERLTRGARVLDLGTGSGAIALALGRERPDLRIAASDVSRAALAVARENAERLGITVDWLHGDWYAAMRERYDVIVSNPPYIEADDPHLDALRHEPRVALVGGTDGLTALRAVVCGASQHLAPGGWLIVEHGHRQGAAVRALFGAAGFTAVATRADLAGNDRATLGRR
jgi:release factor glutamine methyltransferase